VWLVLRLLGRWACGCVAAQCAEGCSFEVGQFSWQVHAGFDAASQLPPTPADPWKDLITSVLEWQAVKGRAKYGERAWSGCCLTPALHDCSAGWQAFSNLSNAAAAVPDVKTALAHTLVQPLPAFFMSSALFDMLNLPAFPPPLQTRCPCCWTHSRSPPQAQPSEPSYSNAVLCLPPVGKLLGALLCICFDSPYSAVAYSLHLPLDVGTTLPRRSWRSPGRPSGRAPLGAASMVRKHWCSQLVLPAMADGAQHAGTADAPR